MYTHVSWIQDSSDITDVKQMEIRTYSYMSSIEEDEIWNNGSYTSVLSTPPHRCRTSTGVLVSPRWLKWECTCAISVLGGATPDVGGDRVRGRDRPVACPGVYWAPRRRSAGWHRGPPRVSTRWGHSYRGGGEMQGRVNATHHTYDAQKWRELKAGLGFNARLSLLDLGSSSQLKGGSRAAFTLQHFALTVLFFCGLLEMEER